MAVAEGHSVLNGGVGGRGDDGGFSAWLARHLVGLNEDVDLDVFVSYIEGILEEDSPDDEKQESLAGLLGEIVKEELVESECKEICSKWAEMLVVSEDKPALEKDKRSIDETIHRIIEQQNIEASRVRVVDEAQMQRKAAILANYSELSDGDEDGEPGEASASTAAAISAPAAAAAPSAPSSEDMLVRNMNALLVKERENKERERSKQEADAKRVKDKDDREKQKTKQQDRKEGEKKRTQKGEKRR